MNTQTEKLKGICNSVLQIDSSIRFVGIISEGGKLIESAKREHTTYLLDKEEESLSLIHTSVKASMHKLWDEILGKTSWTIALKQKVKLITVFLDSKLLVLSTETTADHDKILEKIQNVILI